MIEKVMVIEALAPVIGLAVPAVVVGWIATTWLRIRHGYPLESSWGKAVYPKSTVSEERVTLLTQENAQLKAELGSVKDRLATMERIVTDSGFQLAQEFDRLKLEKDGVQ